MIYYVIYGVLALLALYEVAVPGSCIGYLRVKRIVIGNRQFKYKSNILFIAIILFLIAFASIRWNTGIDFNTYERSYNTVDSIQIEWGFRAIAKVVGSFTQLLTVYAIISIVPVYLIIKRYSNYYFVSILLLFSTLFLRYDMGIIRQGAALALTMYSVQYALNKQWKRFIIFVLLATIFHNSALVFFAICPVINRKIPRSIMLMVAGVCIVMGFTNIWSGLFGLLSHLPIPMMNRYITHFLNNTLNNTKLSITDLQSLILLGGFLCFEKNNKESNEDKIYGSLVNIYFIGTCLFWIFRQFPYFTGRGLSYFLQIEILLIPALLKKIKNKNIRVVAYILVCAYAFWYVYNIVNFDGSTSWMNSSYVPYTTIFSK